MFRSLCLVIATALIAACAAPPAQTVALSNSFWQEKTARIGVVLVEVPKGAVHMVGPQDALDRAIANATDARLRDYLQTLLPREFHQVGELFLERLQAKGYAVSLISQPIERSRYVALQAKGSTKLNDHSITALQAQYGIDRLLVLSIDRFGAFRDYFVFVPTAAPTAMFQVSGELIDLTRNQVLWRVSMAEKQNLLAVEGRWDQPPDYPNLTQTIRCAEHDAAVYLQSAFFGDADVR